MALDRWIALIILGICLVYGYTAWFTMDDSLAPFMRRNPIWPSTFPKLLSIIGVVASFVIVLGFEKSQGHNPEIDYRRLGDYKVGQVVLLLALMVGYALGLRPLGFIIATTGFLIIGSVILGERKWQLLVPVSLVATLIVWYLVQEVLGIFLSPWPRLKGG